MKRNDLINWINQSYLNLSCQNIENFDMEEAQKTIEAFAELKEMISGNSYKERYNILKELNSEAMKKYEDDSKLRTEALKIERETEKILEEKRAENFKKILKPGMVIHVKGTNDRKGFRLVLECNDDNISCRKLNKLIDKSSPKGFKYKKDYYLTNHYWTKITKILEEKFEE